MQCAYLIFRQSWGCRWLESVLATLTSLPRNLQTHLICFQENFVNKLKKCNLIKVFTKVFHIMTTYFLTPSIMIKAELLQRLCFSRFLACIIFLFLRQLTMPAYCEHLRFLPKVYVQRSVLLRKPTFLYAISIFPEIRRCTISRGACLGMCFFLLWQLTRQRDA